MKFEDLEIWDNIPGHDKYKVSSKGRVFSAKSNKYLKPGKNTNGYYIVSLWQNGKQKIQRVHRLVALTFYFINDSQLIDHVDRDKTNNNLLNLRFCSSSENKCNIGLKQNNTSGYKGVSWCKWYKKWKASIKINGKLKHLGYFNKKEEAYEAYKKASKEYHGDFGYAP